jgi:Sulfatase
MRTYQNLGLNREIPNDRHASINELRVFLQQLIATDSLILDLMKQLKSSPNWKSTMLIVASDHGLSLQAGTWKRKYVEIEKPGTLEDLYRVPLFIKYPDQVAGQINDCTSSTVDILPTVAAVKGVSAGWTSDGDDLQKRCIDRAKRTVWWPDGKADMTSGVEDLRQRADFYSKMVPYDGGIDGASSLAPYGALMNRTVSTSTQRDANVMSWTLNQAQQFANISSDEWANIPLEVSGTVVLKEPMPADAMGLVLVNGKVSGMFSEIAGQPAGATVAFRSMLTASALTAGNHVVELAIARGGADSAVITFVGRAS